MDFTEAEEKFQELQSRVQRGEPLSEEQYQEEMQKLMVQDERGTFWSLEPGTGQWLYFDGTEWVPGTPPRARPPVTGISPSEPAWGGGNLGAPGGESSGVMPEGVPTYERPGEPAPSGVAPRPIRAGGLPFGDDNSPWLPFAIGAVVLLLCAVALFFGVRNAPFFGTSAARVTPTTIVEVVPTEPTQDQPTDVPAQDTPTAVAVTPTAPAVTVTFTDRLRVRSGPGTTASVLVTLDSGTKLTAVGRNADSSWIQVQLPNKSDLGWVSAQYVTPSGDVSSLPVVQNPSSPGASATKKPSRPAATETPAG